MTDDFDDEEETPQYEFANISITREQVEILLHKEHIELWDIETGCDNCGHALFVTPILNLRD